LDTQLLRERLGAVITAAASLHALPAATQTLETARAARADQAALAAQPLQSVRMGMGMRMDMDIDMDMDGESNENPAHDQTGLTVRSLSQHVHAFNQRANSIDFSQPPSFNYPTDATINIDTNTNNVSTNLHRNSQHQNPNQHPLQHYSSTSANSSFTIASQESAITSRSTNVNVNVQDLTSLNLNRASELSRLFGGNTIEKKRKRSFCFVTEKVSTALPLSGVLSTNEGNQIRQNYGNDHSRQSGEISETSIVGYQPSYSSGCCSKRCIDCLVDTTDG
jgi:hypothetical protein